MLAIAIAVWMWSQSVMSTHACVLAGRLKFIEHLRPVQKLYQYTNILPLFRCIVFSLQHCSTILQPYNFRYKYHLSITFLYSNQFAGRMVWKEDFCKYSSRQDQQLQTFHTPLHSPEHWAENEMKEKAQRTAFKQWCHSCKCWGSAWHAISWLPSESAVPPGLWSVHSPLWTACSRQASYRILRSQLQQKVASSLCRVASLEFAA